MTGGPTAYEASDGVPDHGDADMDDHGDADMDDHGDAERVSDALYVVTGGQPTGTLRRLAYPLYVLVLLGLTYGFTVSRAFFVTSNPTWVRDHLLGPPAVAGALVVLAVALAVGWRASRHRGPVVPPMAWTDQVLGSSVDRAVAVGPWWRLPMAGSTSGGAVLGAFLGGALWASEVTGPLALVVGVLAGGLVGLALAHAALAGQAGVARPARPSAALRRLRVEDLRLHAATGDHLAGAALAGDPRAALLELAAPPRRGRDLTLRPGRPVAVVVRRDLLGQRRDPFTFWRGAALGLLGSAAVGWTILEPATPAILAALGLLLVHSGTAAWSEGLRMSADQLGPASLTGLTPRRAALAHSILPAGCTLAAWVLGSGAVFATIRPAGTAYASAVALLVAGGYAALLTTATSWLAAYRPPAGDLVLLPGVGPWLLLLRLVLPGLIALLAGALLPSGAQHGAVTIPFVLLVGALAWANERLTSSATRRPD